MVFAALAIGAQCTAIAGQRAAATGMMTYARSPRSWYFSLAGNDAGNGDKQHPFRTLEKLNELTLIPGDTVLLAAGEVFAGSWQPRQAVHGTAGRPVVLGS